MSLKLMPSRLDLTRLDTLARPIKLPAILARPITLPATLARQKEEEKENRGSKTTLADQGMRKYALAYTCQEVRLSR